MEAADPDGGERVVRGREALVVGGQRGAAASYGAPEREVIRHGEGARAGKVEDWSLQAGGVRRGTNGWAGLTALLLAGVNRTKHKRTVANRPLNHSTVSVSSMATYDKVMWFG